MKNLKNKLYICACVLCALGWATASAETLSSAVRTPQIEKNYADMATFAVPHIDLVYKKVGNLECTLDLILPATTTDKDGKPLFPNGAPVVLYLHGGGWKNGVRATSNHSIRYFSKRGIAQALVSYRLLGDSGNTIETCVTDCFDAARWLAKHAAEYKLDPNRMLAYGGSAGGHLTLMEVLADPAAFPGDPALADAQFKFVGGVAICPVATLVDSEARGETDYVRPDRFEELFGKPYDAAQDDAKKVSPLYWLKKDSPRMLIMHGDADRTVNIGGSLMMEKKAKEIGADLTLLRLPNAGHNFKSDRNPAWRVHRLIFLDNLYDMALGADAPVKWSAQPWRNE